jgi:hypothetical protein
MPETLDLDDLKLWPKPCPDMRGAPTTSSSAQPVTPPIRGGTGARLRLRADERRYSRKNVPSHQ